MMKILEALVIRSQLLRDGSREQPFPKAVDFPFDALYRQLATRLPTAEISAECILLSAAEATAETQEFADPALLGNW